jgi:hypothetical protein
MLDRINRLTYLGPDIGDSQRLILRDIRKTTERKERKKAKTAQYNTILQSDNGDGDSIKRKGTNVISLRRKNRDADSLRTNDRDVDNIRNADSARRTDMVPRLEMKNSGHA